MAFERATPRSLTVAAVLVAALAEASAASAASTDDRCKHLAAGVQLDSKLPALIALAECSEQAGNLVDAEAQWTLARDRAKHDEKPQSKARAEARLAAVHKRVARLTLLLAANAPAGVQVLRDDVPLEPASLASALPMNLGEHVIVVKLTGHDDAKYTINLADGDHQTLAITVGPATAVPTASPSLSAPAPGRAPALPTPPPSVAAPPAPQPPVGWWSAQRTTGVILGAAGIVGVGVGSALYIVGSHGAKQRSSNVDVRTSLGAVSAASGGVLLVTALVLLASAPSDEAAPHAGLTLTPTLIVGRSATVLGATGEF